jgi:predicted amidohydrolase YtcJ
MDCCIVNAKVYVRRGEFAQAVLIENGIIKAVGANSYIADMCPSGTKKIDAAGGLLLPGFYDSHLHIAHAGRSLHEIQVYGVKSVQNLITAGRAELERIKPAAGTAIHGTGWNQNEFTEGEKRFPNRFDIDAITSDYPLVLSRVCGHTLSCNTKALEAAGIDKNFPDIPGGSIERDIHGNPTGVFHGNATGLVRGIVKPFTDDQLRAQLVHTLRRASAFGITGAASNDIFDTNARQIITQYNAVFNAEEARLRVYLQCHLSTKTLFDEFRAKDFAASLCDGFRTETTGTRECAESSRANGFVTGSGCGHPFVKIGPLKLFADGSLGSRTAYMSAPYTDDPQNCGWHDASQDQLNDFVAYADRHGFQVVIHAIGDGAVDQCVTAFERITGRHHNPRRHGIVHCEIVTPEILRRMAHNDLCALVQPIFLTHDLYVAVERLGKERAAYCHAFAAMLRLGIPLMFGTDHPVESLNPLDCIRCAVERSDILTGEPSGGFYPDERVDTEAAVDAYTAGSAFHSYEEKIRGRIQSGFLADLVLLDKDIFTLPPDEINTARPVFTMVGGAFSYHV